jgi:hypothetical protein
MEKHLQLDSTPVVELGHSDLVPLIIVQFPAQLLQVTVQMEQ